MQKVYIIIDDNIANFVTRFCCFFSLIFLLMLGKRHRSLNVAAAVDDVVDGVVVVSFLMKEIQNNYAVAFTALHHIIRINCIWHKNKKYEAKKKRE